MIRYLCPDCGAVFDRPDAKMTRSSIYGDDVQLSCPECGGQEFVDADLCPDCREWKPMIQRRCDACDEQLTNIVRSRFRIVIAHMFPREDEREKLNELLDGKWVEEV